MSREIPRDWRMLKLDERQHWHPDVQAQTTAIWGVYAYDRNTHVHVCELTPSYELYWIGIDYIEIDGLTDEQRSELNETIDCYHDSEPVIYMHVSDVDAIVASEPEIAKTVDVGEEIAEAEEAQAEELRIGLDYVVPSLMEGWNTGALRW